jgi:hypothetical protein
LELGNVFYEFALLLAFAGLAGLVAHWLKQPLIVAFIAVGILVGPAGLKWVTIGNEIDLLAKVGVALLLFTVGLKLDLHVIRTMGPVALATGLGQVVFTSVIGYGIGLALGLSHVASLYVAVALTFSSTIIIVKLLSDKREIDSLHGRIAIGFLIVQDLVVVLVMIMLTAFGAGLRGDDWPRDIGMVVLKGTGFLAAFERLKPYRKLALEKLPPSARDVDVIQFGMGRFGSSIARELTVRGMKVLGVDFDPALVRRSRHSEFPIVYGDADDPEFPATLPLSKAAWVVSSVPQVSVNLALLHGLKHREYHGRTALTVHLERDSQILKAAGADLILSPFVDAAKEAADELLAQSQEAHV